MSAPKCDGVQRVWRLIGYKGHWEKGPLTPVYPVQELIGCCTDCIRQKIAINEALAKQLKGYDDTSEHGYVFREVGIADKGDAPNVPVITI